MKHWLYLLTAAVVTSASPFCLAQEPSTPPQASAAALKTRIAPEAEKIARAMGEAYKAAQTARVDVRMVTKVNAAATKQELVSNGTLAVERPNRLAFRQIDGTSGTVIVSDGKKLSVASKLLKRYSVADAPKSLDELVESPAVMMAAAASGAEMLPTQMLLSLFSADPFAQLMSGVEELSLAGNETFRGKPVTVLKGVQGEMDWELWLDAGERPLVRKVSFDMSKSMAKAGEDLPAEMKGMKVEISVELGEWTLGGELPADAFAFTAPEGAQNKPLLDQDGDATEKHPALGKPAPAFSVDLLGGGKLDLAQHRGKNVVILDFWATWCGPCVRALPILTAVAADYRDKGVVFYAVNQGEDAQTIKSFMAAKKLDLTVALDGDSKVGELYGVEGIPQTVIIDKQGVVQVVHVGFSPGLKETLSHDLDALLSAKTPAAE